MSHERRDCTMKKIIFILIPFLLFGCAYNKQITISIEHQPKIFLEEDTTIIINRFWKIDLTNDDVEFIKEFNKLFFEVTRDDFFEQTVIQEKVVGLYPIRQEDKKKDFKIKEPDWEQVRDTYNAKYIVYGAIDFSVEDASGYVYKRVYKPQYQSYDFVNVYQERVMYNYTLRIVMFDLEIEQEIFNKEYTSSITREEKKISRMTEFENMTLDLVDDFLDNFKPVYEKQTRYLIGM